MKQIIFYLLFLFLLSSCQNANDYRKKAEEFITAKKYEQALLTINKAIELEPDSIYNYLLRLRIFDLTGQFKEEILDLNKVIEFDKKRNNKSVYAFQQRAVAQIELGLYKEALSDVDYFIVNRDTIGSLAEAYLNKASIYYKLNDNKNSEKFYKQVLVENNEKNKSIESQAIIGLSNLSKSPKDALELLNKAIALDERYYAGYGARAAIYIDLGKVDLAYDDLKKGMSFNPSDAT